MTTPRSATSPANPGTAVTTGPETALESLAAALGSTRYAITLYSGHRPLLIITYRGASMLTESVYAHGGWYWWAWGEKLAPTSDPAQAAHNVGSVLCLA